MYDSSEYQDLQRSWVTKCRSNVVGDLVLWREVDLFEKLWGNRKTSGSPESPQCRILIVMVVMKVVLAIDGIAAGMVFLDVWEVRHIAVCLRLAFSCDLVVDWSSFVLHKDNVD